METIMTIRGFEVVKKEMPVMAGRFYTSVFAGKVSKTEAVYHIERNGEYLMSVGYSPKAHIFENNINHAIDSALILHGINE